MCSYDLGWTDGSSSGSFWRCNCGLCYFGRPSFFICSWWLIMSGKGCFGNGDTVIIINKLNFRTIWFNIWKYHQYPHWGCCREQQDYLVAVAENPPQHCQQDTPGHWKRDKRAIYYHGVWLMTLWETSISMQFTAKMTQGRPS